MLLMVRILLLQGKSCSPGVELASSRRGKTPTPAIMLIPKKNRKEVYKYLFKGNDQLHILHITAGLAMHGSWVPNSQRWLSRQAFWRLHDRCQYDGGLHPTAISKRP